MDLLVSVIVMIVPRSMESSAQEGESAHALGVGAMWSLPLKTLTLVLLVNALQTQSSALINLILL